MGGMLGHLGPRGHGEGAQSQGCRGGGGGVLGRVTGPIAGRAPPHRARTHEAEAAHWDATALLGSAHGDRSTKPRLPRATPCRAPPHWDHTSPSPTPRVPHPAKPRSSGSGGAGGPRGGPGALQAAAAAAVGVGVAAVPPPGPPRAPLRFRVGVGRRVPPDAGHGLTQGLGIQRRTPRGGPPPGTPTASRALPGTAGASGVLPGGRGCCWGCGSPGALRGGVWGGGGPRGPPGVADLLPLWGRDILGPDHHTGGINEDVAPRPPSPPATSQDPFPAGS